MVVETVEEVVDGFEVVVVDVEVVEVVVVVAAVVVVVVVVVVVSSTNRVYATAPMVKAPSIKAANTTNPATRIGLLPFRPPSGAGC